LQSQSLNRLKGVPITDEIEMKHPFFSYYAGNKVIEFDICRNHPRVVDATNYGCKSCAFAEIMKDVGAHHFAKASPGEYSVLVPQLSENEHDPLIRHFCVTCDITS